MPEHKNTYVFVISIIALVIASISIAYTGYYLTSIEGRLQVLESSIVKVHILIDYGNGTVQSYDVMLTKGLTVLDALRSVAEVEVKMFPELGAYIVAINGVRESYERNMFWMWYIKKDGEWELAPVGAGNYVPKEEVSVMFRYQVPPW